MTTRGSVVGIAACGAVVAAAAAAALVPSPPDRPPAAPPAEVPVTSTVLGCSALGGGRYASTTAQVPGADGPARVRPVRPSDGTVVVDGPGAVGLLAWRAETTAESAAGPTAATTACLSPRTEWWFAGAGAGLDHRSDVVLTNPDDGQAVVDVDLVGTSGEVDEAALRDLIVPAGGSRVIRLVDVAPRSDELTVHVTTSQGRVVAQVRDAVRSATRRAFGVGHEWVPASSSPATDVRLLGLPAVADRRTLLVTNTSATQALVSAQVVTDDGAFIPSGADEISVDPGSVVAVDLTASLDRRFAGVRLRSDVAVTGTVRSQVGTDVAYAAAADVATGSLAAPTTGRETTLLLQGTDEPTGGTATAWSATGRELGSRGLSVPPSGVATWSLPARTAYVVLEPDTGRGELVAALVATGPGVTAMPLVTVPTTQTRPVVRQRTEETR